MTLGARMAELARMTLKDPQRAARALLAEGVPLGARSAGLLLVAVLSALLASLHVGNPEGLDPFSALMLGSPIQAAVFQWLFLAATVFLMHRVGRAFGGRGSFADALLVVVWLQLIMLGFQLLQFVLMPISPDVAGLVGLVSFGIYLWLMTVFIAELHGFTARGMVFLVMLLTALAAGFLLAMVMILLFGPEALIANV